MKTFLLLIIAGMAVSAQAQKARSQWAFSFPQDSVIIDYTVNSKDEIVCIGEDRNETAFSMVLDATGRVISKNTLGMLDDVFSGFDEEHMHERIICGADDQVYFIGRMEDRYVNIINYKTMFDEETGDDNIIFIAQLDSAGRLRELHPIVHFGYGVIIGVPGLALNADGTLSIAVTAYADPDKQPKNDKYAFSIEGRDHEVEEYKYSEFLLKLRPDFSVLWISSLLIDNTGVKASSDPDDFYFTRNMVLDAKGNCYRALNYTGRAFIGGKEIMPRAEAQLKDVTGAVIKYTAAGDVAWIRPFGNITDFIDICLFDNRLILTGGFESDFKQDGFAFQAAAWGKLAMFGISLSNGKITWINNDAASLSVMGTCNETDQHLYALTENKIMAFDKNMKARITGSYNADIPRLKVFRSNAYMMGECERGSDQVLLGDKEYQWPKNKQFIGKMQIIAGN